MPSALELESRIGDIRWSVSPTGQLLKKVVPHDDLTPERVNAAFDEIVANFSGSSVLELHDDETYDAIRGAIQAGVSYKVPITTKDTLSSDTSYYQSKNNLAVYPYWDWCLRTNDGNFTDPLAQANLAIGRQGLAVFGDVAAPNPAGLAMLGVYLVFRDNWDETVRTMERAIGTPHPRMWYMGDLERWGGGLSGNKSAAFNSFTWAIAEWHASYFPGMTNAQAYKRVHGYANAGDRASLCPTWPSGLNYVLANYSSNVGPAHLVHQFGSTYKVDPFGPSDINSADGYNVAQLAAARGIALPTPTPPKPPTPTVEPSSGNPMKDLAYALVYGLEIGEWTRAKHPHVFADLGKGGIKALVDWAQSKGYHG